MRTTLTDLLMIVVPPLLAAIFVLTLRIYAIVHRLERRLRELEFTLEVARDRGAANKSG